MSNKRLINVILILLIVTSCIFVGVRSYQSVQAAQASNTALAQFQLPLFEKIQHLRSVLAVQNLAFHNYYLTNDDDAFTKQFSKHQTDAAQLIRHISNDFGENDNLILLSADLDKIDKLALEMKSVMISPTDWDGARDVLSKLEPITTSISGSISTLITDIEKDVIKQAEKSLSQIEQSLFWTLLLNGGLLIVLGMLLWFDAKRSRAQKEILRFAGFPERNPRPVLALTASGEISYANPSSSDLCNILFNSNNMRKLLPNELDALLIECKFHNDYLEGEYCLEQQYYEYVLQRLPDLNEYRLYLSDITARKIAEHNLMRLAYYSELTNLDNKSSLQRDLSISTNSKGSILLIDIITLSQVTIRLGHSATDTAIVICAKKLDAICKSHDAKLYHLGDERFAARLDSSEDDNLFYLLDAMTTSFAQAIAINGLDFFIHLAIGVAHCTENLEFDTLLKQANIALRSTSERGGVAIYTDRLEMQTQAKMDIEAGLRNAIRKKQLVLYFQPQINLKTNQISGVEALLRWCNDDGNWISPADFIPIAEESDLIIEIGNWVLRQSIKASAKFNKKITIHPFIVAINIAPVQLLRPGFCHQVLELLSEYDVEPGAIELEVTESAALYDIELAIAVMKELQENGLKLAMDDFGTGYSSFSYITQLPLNKLKIDQSFIRNMLIDPKLCNVIETMIAIAGPLSLTVIAEGVESFEHLQVLQRWGCNEAQGYYIAKPMPYEQLLKWVSRLSVK